MSPLDAIFRITGTLLSVFLIVTLAISAIVIVVYTLVFAFVMIAR